jgi:heme-degrading monooxygenase HmoA
MYAVCHIDIMEPYTTEIDMSLRPLDPAFPIERQIGLDASPVVLVNVFTLDQADEPAFLKVWQDDADFMKRQSGFISTQLHRAIGESPTYLNYAVWETNAQFRAAFMHPEFQAKISAYPSSSVASPHLFQKVAVPGICVA